MKLTTAIKKLQKEGFEVINDFNQHFTAKKENSNKCIEFSKNGDSVEITCISTRRLAESDKIESDYFCGTYHNNLTQAINFIA